MRIELDPRFLNGIRLFDEGEYLDASEEFEDLFFEAVRDEVDFVRVFMQLSVGIHHVERGQLRAAIERLEEGVRVMRAISNRRGWALDALAVEVAAAIGRIEARIAGDGSAIAWPKLSPYAP